NASGCSSAPFFFAFGGPGRPQLPGMQPMDKLHGAMAVGRLVEISVRNSARTSADQGAASAAEGPDKSLESWQEPGPYDPAGRLGSWEERRAAGKAVRGRVPREAHAEWQPPADRPDPVGTLLASNEGRQGELLPLRMER